MKRREFLRRGVAIGAAPALLPFLDLSSACAAPPRSTDGGVLDDIRLLANENPLGLPASLQEAVTQGLAGAHQYPGASEGRLRAALAARHGVEPESIVAGHGSTDVLRMIVQALVAREPDLRFVTAEPTFEHPEGYAAPLGVEPVRIPLVPGSHAHDLEGMRRAAEGGPAGGRRRALIYICNPNNPTGGLTPTNQVKRWIDAAPADHLFLVDEAYFEFVDDPRYEGMDDWARSRRNVVVVRTFSKIYGMAGIRLGYAVAHPDTAARLRAFALATGSNHLANVAGLAALEEADFARRALEVNAASRRIVEETLDELEIPYMESHTNFVMHGVNGDVEPYRERMAAEGLLVGRPFPPLMDHNRVSLGTPDQMHRWAEALRRFRENHWI